MNPQQNQDWKRKLQELEAQMNQGTRPNGESEPLQPLQSLGNNPQLAILFNKISNWFTGLSGTGKIVAVSAGALVGFALLRTIFELVASLISLSVLIVVLYLVYKVWVAPRQPK